MNIKNKMVAAIAVAVMLLPGITLAQSQPMTSAQLLAEIQALTAQLQALQAQANAQGGQGGGTDTGTTSAPSWCYTFTSNLSVGMTGAAVTALQTALQQDGESVTITGTFDDQTAAAVTGFQQKYKAIILTPAGLSNGTGYAGKATRAELNALFGCGTSTTPPPTPAPVPPPSPTPTPISSPTPPPLGTTTSKVPVITSISPTQAGSADSVTISGSNFTSGGNPAIKFYNSNGALAGSMDFISMKYVSAQSLIFSPATNLSLPTGVTYQVYVSTPNGMSNAMNFTLTAPATTIPPITACPASGCSGPTQPIGIVMTLPATAAPYFSLAGGVYSNLTSQTLTLTDSTPGATIYYTTDGSTPTSLSPVYAGPITVNTTELVKAIAVAPGYAPSSVGSKSYVFAPPAAAPYFGLAGGTYAIPQSLTLTESTPGATIYYTTDGTGPTTASPIYSGPISIATTEIVKAFAVATGYAVSPVSSKSYTIGSTSTSTPKLSVGLNTGFGTQVVSAGMTGVRIGSYAFTASAVEGVNINTVTIQAEPNAGINSFQNLKVMVNGVQFGMIQGIVTAGGTYAFSGSPFNVPAGSTVNVDVYADALSTGSGTYSPATALVGYSGSTATSFTPVNFTGSIVGQTVTFASAPTLTVAIDSSNPPAGQIVQNSTGNTLAVFRFTNTSNGEAIKVTQLKVVDAVTNSGVRAAFSNVGLWNGSTLLGVAASPVLDAAGTGYIYSFNSFSAPLIVPMGNSVSLTLKGDAGSYTAGSLTDNSMQTMGIVTTSDVSNNTPAMTMVARGATSNMPANVTLSNAVGNLMTMLRTVLNVAGSTVTPASPSLAQIGSITLTANSAGDAQPMMLRLTFGGNGISYGGAAFLNTVVLKNPSGNNIVSLGQAFSSNNGSNMVTWAFSTSSPTVVTAGTSYTLQLWANTSVIPAQPGIAESLTATIQNASDFMYFDGTNNAPAIVSLPANVVPLTVSSLQGGVGQQP